MVRLAGERVVLRPLEQDELDAVMEARRRLRVGAWTGGARGRARLRRRLQHSGQMVRGHLDLAVEAESRLVGEIQARGDPAQTLPPGVYELGIVVHDPADRGKGYGAEAVGLLTRWLFEHAGAARVQASTAVDNTGMRRVLERLGFTCEGVMRAFTPPEGPGQARADYALYAITKVTDPHVAGPAPSWPASPPAHGPVVLRPFRDEDAHLALELGDDPYIPLIGSLPAHPSAQQALEWVHRQRGQLAERGRFSFVIADADSGTAVGAIGLSLHLPEGRATAGYAVSPLHRGRGVATSALRALTAFAWTIPALHRVELYIEPWNAASIGAAEAAGYRREGLLRSHQEIGSTRRDMLLYAATRP